MRELEQARSEEQRAIENLEEAQERLNEATKEYNDATADTPANILRMAEAKQKLDDAIADVKALDGFRGALLQIVEDTGVGLGDIYKQLMDIANFKTTGGGGGNGSSGGGGGSNTTNTSTGDFDADFKRSQEESLEKVLEKQATQKILEDPRFVGGASGVTTLINLKNEFNISGEINSDEVALKAIEAQKRGLNVIL